MAQGRILVVEDDADIAEAVRIALEREGFDVEHASEGRRALAVVESSAPDALVLDLMLPGMDGFEICREIRRSRTLPILILSARDDDMDKILGLEIGADDYLTKPFNPRELVARVKALLRRARQSVTAAEELIQRGPLKIDVRAQNVDIGGRQVPLTPTEFGLLRALSAEPGHVLSRQVLLDRVWGPDFFGDERTVDSHIRNLRAKLQKEAPGPQYIRSVWGVGYKFEV